jgi:hypothetical protein
VVETSENKYNNIQVTINGISEFIHHQIMKTAYYQTSKENKIFGVHEELLSY